MLLMFSCGNRTTSNDATAVDTIAATEDSVKSESKANTLQKLIVEPLPALTEEVLQYYEYEAKFILFDTIRFTHKDLTYKIYLERFEAVRFCPGEFHLMTIDCNGKENVFFNPDGWSARYVYDGKPVPTTMLDSASRDKALEVYWLQELKETVKNNLIDKRYIAITELSPKDIVLIAWGYPYASNPGQLTIFNLTRFDEPTLIYNDTKELIEIADYNKDGVLDIGTSSSFSDEIVDKNGAVVKRDKVKRFLLKDGWFYEE